MWNGADCASSEKGNDDGCVNVIKISNPWVKCCTYGGIICWHALWNMQCEEVRGQPHELELKSIQCVFRFRPWVCFMPHLHTSNFAHLLLNLSPKKYMSQSIFSNCKYTHLLDNHHYHTGKKYHGRSSPLLHLTHSPPNCIRNVTKTPIFAKPPRSTTLQLLRWQTYLPRFLEGTPWLVTGTRDAVPVEK